MKKMMVVGAIVAAIMLIPEAVMAAVGTFSTTTSTPAVKGTSTGSGQGGYFYSATTGTAGTGVYGLAHSTKTGTSGVYGFANGTTGVTYGVYGRSSSSSLDASGVYGLATGTNEISNELHAQNGVYGRATGKGARGVYGLSTGSIGFGVSGAGTEVGVYGSVFNGSNGDGNYGMWSVNDMGIGGHLIADPGATGSYPDLAGFCAVGNSGSAECDFHEPFASGEQPIVVVTPAGDPGASARWWVTAAPTMENGFVLHLSPAPAGNVTFNYIVVGVLPQ